VNATALVANNTPQGGAMERFFSVSEVASRLGANPRDVSDLFYRRELRDDVCPIVAGRRLIPDSYVQEIESALRRHRRPFRVAALSTDGRQ
jgi:hypothetical protein